MSEEDRRLTRQFVEIGDAHISAESACDVEDNLQSQILERKISSSEVDRRTIAIVAPLVIQSETLIQSLRKLSEKRYNRSTQEIVASERSKSGRRSDNACYWRYFTYGQHVLGRNTRLSCEIFNLLTKTGHSARVFDEKLSPRIQGNYLQSQIILSDLAGKTHANFHKE